MNKTIGIIFLFIFLNSISRAQTDSNKQLNTTPTPIDSNVIVNKGWGVSFLKNANWSVTNHASSRITITQTSGESAGNEITIEYISGVSIIDIDSKFGSITYYHDNKKRAWMVLVEEDKDLSSAIIPKRANETATTKDGLPIFRGTGRWLTYIIPLSHTTFLKLNISGDGDSHPLEDLVKTLRKL